MQTFLWLLRKCYVNVSNRVVTTLFTQPKLRYSRTPILRPPSKSDWSGRKTGVVVHEGLDYVITCGLRHTRIYILTVSSTPRTSFGVHCRTRENSTNYPLHCYSVFRHRRQRPTCLTQNSAGLRWPRFPTTMLSFSWINPSNISISGLIKPRSENIVHILVAAFTLLALLPHSCYVHSRKKEETICQWHSNSRCSLAQ